MKYSITINRQLVCLLLNRAFQSKFLFRYNKDWNNRRFMM